MSNDGLIELKIENTKLNGFVYAVMPGPGSGIVKIGGSVGFCTSVCYHMARHRSRLMRNAPKKGTIVARFVGINYGLIESQLLEILKPLQAQCGAGASREVFRVPGPVMLQIYNVFRDNFSERSIENLNSSIKSAVGELGVRQE